MRSCTYCGANMADDARVCGNCGRPSTPPAQAGSWQQQPPFQQQPPQPGPWPQQQAGGAWPPQPPMQQPFMPPPGGNGPQKRSNFPGWIFIVLIVVVVLGGAIAAFALINRHPNQTATGSTPTTVPTLGISLGSPVLNGSPLATPTVSLDCPGGPSRTASFSFSGSVSGTMSIIQFSACGPVSVTENGTQVKGYLGEATGVIGITPYQFIFTAFPYNSPGTFTSTQVAGTLTETATGNQRWENTSGKAAATITVNSDGKSGSLNITLPQTSPTSDPNNTVKVTGTWSA